MNRTYSDLQNPSRLDLTTTSDVSQANVRRLAMILFEVEEEALLARQILEMTGLRNLSVLLIGVALDPTDESRLRRRLARLAGFLRDQTNSATQVQIRMEAGRDWMGGIRRFLRPDDMLGCYSEQTVGALERPLCDVLSSNMNLPVYAFSGLRSPRQHRRNRLSQAVSWLGSLASLGGFFLIQARIVSQIQGWTQAVLLLLLLFAEAGLLWFLNSLLAQS